MLPEVLDSVLALGCEPAGTFRTMLEGLGYAVEDHDGDGVRGTSEAHGTVTVENFADGWRVDIG